jgi:hypothetical protein
MTSATFSVAWNVASCSCDFQLAFRGLDPGSQTLRH